MDIKKNTGKDELRARDLFTALWIPDNFMHAVRNGGDWYLFCPNDIKKAGLKPLQESYGDEYEQTYAKAVELGLGKKVSATEVWTKILESQIETGVPYLCSKDNANKKTNHQNIGVIHQSNLCAEIFQYTDEETTAICTLSSMVLKNFIIDGKFDFKLLFDEVRKVTRTLNKVININSYSTQKGLKGGLEQRAIAIGVQGLADVFYLMDYVFTSEEARKLNKEIFETLYFAAMTASKDQAIEFGTYETYAGSPVSNSIFQYDMWGVVPSNRWDWSQLKAEVKKHGVRNSLLLAPMPTASTAQILGNNECFEPYTSNLYTRRVLSGEFIIVIRHLLKDLVKAGLWNRDMRLKIMSANGSIQNISEIPQDIKDLYKTAWEISQKTILELAADRGAYICQSQSLNIFMENANFAKLTSMHFYGWEKGLKTGMYYLRTKAATDAIKFTVDQAISSEPEALVSEVGDMTLEEQAALACSLENPDSCEMCSG